MAALKPSDRALAIRDSITLAISARAAAMRAAGQDVISLGAGEPDFGTPQSVRAAGIQAIEEGRTRYTPAPGMPKVREAGARWFQSQWGLTYTKEQVMVTAGAKPALNMAMFALIEPGQKVLLPAPFWPSYPDIVKLAGGVPVELPGVPDQGFVHSGAQLEQALRDSGAVGMVINFPNNPSGAVPSEAQVAEVVEAAKATDTWILSDEIYAGLIYDDKRHHSPAAAGRDGFERTIVVNGATKTHSMTGWRVGFLAGPEPIVSAASRLQSQAIGNPCTISQEAVVEVCTNDDPEELDRRREAFDQRRRYLMGAINEIDGMALELPEGAFYALVDVRALCERRGCDDTRLCTDILEQALVATVPGSAFAMPGFLRLSYAASMEDLEGAVARLREFAKS